MFEQIYHKYLLHKNEENRKNRYEGEEDWYHASGAGFCSRKLYFESVEKTEPTNTADDRNLRVMRLGTVLHEEFENALLYYNNINNINNINNTTNINNNCEVSIAEDCRQDCGFLVEGEIKLPEYNVRGFFDILYINRSSSGEQLSVELYDLKSASNWNFRKKFGSKILFPPENRNYNLQLGTYGLAIKKKYGSLNKMSLLFYNKDNSKMAEESVSLDFLDKAKRYWHSINEEHSKGLPGFQYGTSPAYAWCCGYCQFKDRCNPPNFKNK